MAEQWTYDSGTKTLTVHGDFVWDEEGYISKSLPWADVSGDIEKIVFETGITTIPDYTFDSYFSLKEVVLPEGLTKIGYAFNGCSSIEQYNLPSTLKTISYWPSCQILNVKLPTGVTDIETAFSANETLETLDLHGTQITEIASAALTYEWELKSVDLGASKLTTIGEGAFQSDYVLESLVLPKTLKSVGQDAFESVTTLTTVYYEGSQAQWNAISIGYGNEALTNATIIYNYKAAVVEVRLDVTPPKKTTYKKGESLDLTGMVATVVYDDGSTEDVTSSATVSGYDPNTEGTQTITVSYSTVSGNFTVTVYDETPNRLDVEPPTKTIYKKGEKLDLSGIKITAVYDDGHTENITTGYTVSGYDSLIMGEQTVTVSYDGLIGTFDVIVDGIIGIEVTQEPSPSDYEVGNTVTLQYMVVSLVYYSGKKEPIDEYSVDLDVPVNTGNYTATISYTADGQTYTTTQTGSVYHVDSISVVPPDCTVYKMGDALNTNGLLVHLMCSDEVGRNEISGYTVSGFDSQLIGTQTITVHRGELTATFDVVVRSYGASAYRFYKLEILAMSGTGSANLAEMSLYDIAGADAAQRAGSIYSASNQMTGNEPERAFDEQPNTFWQGYAGSSTNWLQAELKEPASVIRLGLIPKSTTEHPISFILYGSTDGENYTILFGQNELNDGWESGVERVFSVQNTSIESIDNNGKIEKTMQLYSYSIVTKEYSARTISQRNGVLESKLSWEINNGAKLTLKIKYDDSGMAAMLESSGFYIMADGIVFSGDNDEGCTISRGEDGTVYYDAVFNDVWTNESRAVTRTVYNDMDGLDKVATHCVILVSKPSGNITINGAEYDSTRYVAVRDKDSCALSAVPVPSGMRPGTAKYILYFLLMNSGGWCIDDTVPDESWPQEVYDFETERQNLGENVKNLQETFGGMLLVNTREKKIALVDEERWRPASGIDIRGRASIKTVSKKIDREYYSRFYPYGYNGLNIITENHPNEYIDIEGTADEPNIFGRREKVIENTGIYTQEALMAWAIKEANKQAFRRVSYDCDILDAEMVKNRRMVNVEIGDTARLYDEDVQNYPAELRIVSCEYNFFDEADGFSCTLGDPKNSFTGIVKDIMGAVETSNSFITTVGAMRKVRSVTEMPAKIDPNAIYLVQGDVNVT